MSRPSEQQEQLKGLAWATTAFAAWGLLPIFWKLLDQVPAFEILNHRILWSAVWVGLLVTVRSRWGEVGQALRSRRTLAMISASTLILACNWLLFIWAVNSGYVLEVSLGYFINPIFSVLLGILFLRERLRRPQYLAVGLAAAGVLFLTLYYGQFPWIGIGLAFTFGIYGLVRKTAPVDALLGLALETLALALPSIAYLTWLESAQASSWSGDPVTLMLLAAAGPATSLPLLWFALGARRLRLTTMGLLQYIGPSIQFVLAVFVFRERFTSAHLIAFSLVWTALAIFSLEALWTERLTRRRMRAQSG